MANQATSFRDRGWSLRICHSAHTQRAECTVVSPCLLVNSPCGDLKAEPSKQRTDQQWNEEAGKNDGAGGRGERYTWLQKRADCGHMDTARAWETVGVQPKELLHTERKGWRRPRAGASEKRVTLEKPLEIIRGTRSTKDKTLEVHLNLARLWQASEA